MSHKSADQRDARELQKLYGAPYQMCLTTRRQTGNFADAARALEGRGFKMKPESDGQGSEP
jgi:hypothetical protein